MDLYFDSLDGSRGGERLIVFRLQPFAGNHAAEGAMDQRIRKLIHDIAHVLVFHVIFENAVNISLIPPHRLSIRWQDDILLGTPSEVFALGAPTFQGDLGRAGRGTLDIQMNHRAICINPKANRAFVFTRSRVDRDAAGL